MTISAVPNPKHASACGTSNSEVHGTDRVVLCSSTWPGIPSRRKSIRCARTGDGAFGHSGGNRLAHRRVFCKQMRLDAQNVSLQCVAVGDEAAYEEIGTTRALRQTGSDETPGAALARGNCGSVLAQKAT